MNDNVKRFRKAFITEPTHDVSPLKDDVEDIVFILTGYEDLENSTEALTNMSTALQGFDPKKDVVIPMGRIVSNFYLGVALKKLFPLGNYALGLYREKRYEYFRL